MIVEALSLPYHPETRKFEYYFVGAENDFFKDFGIASINVLVHAMSLLGQEASLNNVIANLKNQGTNLIMPTNTDSQIGEILESLKTHPKEHYQAMITSTLVALSQQPAD